MTDHIDGQKSDATHLCDAVNGGGRGANATRSTYAPATPSASNGGALGRVSDATPDSHARSDLIDQIQAMHRMRTRWMNAERSLTLQAKAFCRSLCGGDKAEADTLYRAALDLIAPPPRRAPAVHPVAQTAMFAILPLVVARDGIEREKAALEKALLKKADDLPPDVLAFCDGVTGFGRASLVAIIGECGDLDKYAGPAKVWKTMGLSVRRDDERGDVAAKRIIEDRYPCRRRALMHVVVTGMTMAGKAADSEWYQHIIDRKTHAATKVDHEGKPWTPMRALRYAQRWVAKRLLREIWRAWRAEGAGHTAYVTPKTDARPH